MMRARPLLMAVALLLAACAPDAPGPPAETPVPDPALRSLAAEWDLVALDGAPVLDSVRVTLDLSSRPLPDPPGHHAFRGHDGCNAFWGSYAFEAPERGGPLGLAFAERIGELQLCGTPVMDQADAFSNRLGVVRQARRDGERLVLSDSLGAEVLAFRVRPLRPVDLGALRRGRWRLDRVLPPPAMFSELPPPPPPPPAPPPPRRWPAPDAPPGTMPPDEPPPPLPNRPPAPPARDASSVVVTFGATTFEVTADCAVLRGTYAVDGDDLTVPSSERDDTGCPQGSGFVVFDAGIETGEIEVSADRLVIHAPNGGRTVYIRP